MKEEIVGVGEGVGSDVLSDAEIAEIGGVG